MTNNRHQQEYSIMKFSMDLSGEISNLREIALKHLTDTSTRLIRQRLNVLFLDPRDQQRLAWESVEVRKDPDLSAGFRLIDNTIIERLLSDENKQFIDNYINEHWQEQLKKAMDTAMEHHARKLAFQRVAELKKET